MEKLVKYGLAVVRDGKLLVQKESDQTLYLMPGGRPEPGESLNEAFQREIREELGVELVTESLTLFGSFEDVAAGRKDTIVHMDVYFGSVRGEFQPCSEVEELVWFGRDDDVEKLSPIIRNHIFPALVSAGHIR